jgi:hypothetical protein
LRKLVRVVGTRCENGDLLDAAEAAGFDVFVTTDRNLLSAELADRWIAIRAHERSEDDRS